MRKPRAHLADILARSLGNDAAAAHIERACGALGYGELIDADEALRVLESLAKEDGLVGIAARFAKARVHLAWEPSPLRR